MCELAQQSLHYK